MSMKGTNATRLDSRKLTDDDGLPLRSSHFPFRLDKQVPPRSAGYTMRVRPIDQTLAPSRKLSLNTSTSSIPTTYMMVDYQQDRKQISAKLLSDSMKAQQRHLNIPASFSTDRDKSSPTPKKHNPMRAQPLRSSFILQSRLPGDQDLNPIIMFNKEDKAVQSDAPIERQEMSISAYQAWSSKTVEPFFKVSALPLCPCPSSLSLC